MVLDDSAGDWGEGALDEVVNPSRLNYATRQADGQGARCALHDCTATQQKMAW
jgi:hypothetical protein